jgi:hypothetical protein
MDKKRALWTGEEMKNAMEAVEDGMSVNSAANT